MKIAKQIAKKILVILLIVFGGLTLLGGSVFTIAMSVAGWDFSVMNTVDFKRQTYVETQSVSNLKVSFNTADIKVYFYESATQVRVEYAETYTKRGEQLTKVTILEEGDSLQITQGRLKTAFLESSFKGNDDVVIYLPQGRAYTLDLKASTGDITLDGTGNLSNLTLTTTTGKVLVNGNVTATEKVKIQTNTGDIFIRNSLAAPEVEVRASTGDVRLGNMSGDVLRVGTTTGDVICYNDSVLDFLNLQFKVGTGDVSLRLVGTYTDYDADVKTSTGDVFLAGYPNESAPRKLVIHTSTGDIRGVYASK